MVSLSFLSRARNFSRSNCGMEKGLWEKSIFLSSSFHSYMGKSTIQQNLYSPSGISFSSRPIRVRARPGDRTHRLVLEGFEFDLGAAEDVADIHDFDGIAQVRLVGAVFQHRFG